MPETRSSVIRLARRSDAPGLAAMSRDLIEYGLRWRWRPNRLLAAINDPDSSVIVADDGDGPVGFAVMSFRTSSAHLSLLAVLPERRKRGIGVMMLEWLIQSCRVAGIGRIHLEVRSSNDNAITFYKRYHFESVGLRRGYYDHREDATLMTLKLLTDNAEELRP